MPCIPLPHQPKSLRGGGGEGEDTAKTEAPAGHRPRRPGGEQERGRSKRPLKAKPPRKAPPGHGFLDLTSPSRGRSQAWLGRAAGRGRGARHHATSGAIRAVQAKEDQRSGGPPQGDVTPGHGSRPSKGSEFSGWGGTVLGMSFWQTGILLTDPQRRHPNGGPVGNNDPSERPVSDDKIHF